MSDVTDQIKERLGVAELVGEYLRLEKAGSNYKALCPFHNEKTPSFMVNVERNFWYCFGCQKGGDIFSFVQEMEGIEFREALERFAERTGVDLPKYSPRVKQEKSQKQKTLEILDLATKVYEHQLQNHAKGGQIKKYLEERKIDDELISQFRLGFAPDGWRNVLNFLTSKKYSPEEISKTGLLVQKEGTNDFYDRFRDRIMFSIIDVTGKVVGYSARVAPGGDESSAKYINTTQTEVYDKSRVLYGLFQAKTAIRKENFVIVVEGNTDVISSHKAGLGNIVAVSGTALTEEHAKILGRYSKNIKLCFDMDEAGQRATRRSIQTCLNHGMEVEIIFLPEGMKDVNDLVCENANSWKQVVDKAVPVMDYFFQSVLKKYDVDDIREKKIIAQDLLSVIRDISDPIEQSYWLRKLSTKIGVDEEVLTSVLEKAKLEKDNTHGGKEVGQTKEREEKKKSKAQVLQERLLGLFFSFQAELKDMAVKLDKGFFDDEYQFLFDQVVANDVKDNEDVLNEMSLKVRFSYDEKLGFIENEVDPVEEWELVLSEIKKEKAKEKKGRIVLDIKRAEDEGDEEAAELLMGELRGISKE